MSLKFLAADNTGTAEGAAAACSYAAQMRQLWETSGHAKGANVRVVNASFGKGFYSQSFVDAVKVLSDRDILFVASACNVVDGSREPNNELVPMFPANFEAPNVISVAATDQNDLLTGSSHFGPTSVDLGAPGLAILSTTPNNTYSKMSGTSTAAPHVSGAAALLWAQNPNLTVSQVKNLLLLNGDVAPSLANKTLTGRRLNVFKSFQSLNEVDTNAPGTVTSFQITSQNGRTFNLAWTASGDDGPGGGPAALYEVDFVDGTTNAVFP